MRISGGSSDVCSSDFVKAGDACRLFQHHASFCGLGRNGGSNLALTYERRAMCARGGIGEDQRHGFGPHIAAIGALSAASAAFDTAHDLQLPILADGNGTSDFVRFSLGEENTGEVRG